MGDGSIKLQRSQRVKVLRERFEKCKGGSNTAPIIEGKVEDISFLTSSAEVHIVPKDGKDGSGSRTLTCRRIIGCDGINSKVRKILAMKVSRSFRTKSVRCPSANLIFDQSWRQIQSEFHSTTLFRFEDKQAIRYPCSHFTTQLPGATSISIYAP